MTGFIIRRLGQAIIVVVGVTLITFGLLHSLPGSLARDILGNPFRPTAVDPAWRECNHGAVRHIGEQILRTGSFADLPILADALEDAGCSDAAILEHCRSGGPHAPGCWALDAVLGR